MTPTQGEPAPSSSVHIPTMPEQPTMGYEPTTYVDANENVAMTENAITHLTERLKSLEDYNIISTETMTHRHDMLTNIVASLSL